MIIYLNILTEFNELKLSSPLTWDEYRIMIGDGLGVYSQSRSRGFPSLSDDINTSDFIDYLAKIQSSKSSYTLNLFADLVTSITVLEYMSVVFSFEKFRCNVSSGEIDKGLLDRLINNHDKNVRAGISF